MLQRGVPVNEQIAFKPYVNRFGQWISVESQRIAYDATMQQLDAIYGPGDTYEVVCHDIRQVKQGKRKVWERFEVSRETVSKHDTAMQSALHYC
jgi:hypothetical protein